jgi:hypothetical protein
MPQCPNPHRSERLLLPWFGATAQYVGCLTRQAVISLGADGRYDLDAGRLAYFRRPGQRCKAALASPATLARRHHRFSAYAAAPRSDPCIARCIVRSLGAKADMSTTSRHFWTAHSAKPPQVRTAIERMHSGFDAHSRLELFARAKVNSWTRLWICSVRSAVRKREAPGLAPSLQLPTRSAEACCIAIDGICSGLLPAIALFSV